ncbi:MAG TPA: hypothetical protein VK446_13455 [Methylocystis sp.]|nr:hypothetical protein [Methylocystis sp.]
MAEEDVSREIEQRFTEPLLPIEKKLVGWSLGVGVVSLIALAVLSRFLPN